MGARPRKDIADVTKGIDRISELEAASGAHIEWLRNFHRIIVCGLPYSEALIAKDAHHNCVFGKWYDSQAVPQGVDGALFERIGQLHQALHEAATRLILTFRRDGQVNQTEYDHFMAEVVTFNDLLRRLQSELWGQISTNDPLTGLQSWHRLLVPVDSESGIRKGQGSTACAAMCDLDHFKRVNDTYGHQAGDTVLRWLGECLKNGVRPNDLVYRYGGEEFLLYLGSTSLPEARVVCERLRAAIEAMEITDAADAPLRITASFGIAVVDAARPFEDIITRSDIALYAAKEHGRNRVYYWQEGEVLPHLP
ncbi:MAG: diguanylate cyclase [Alphaproteobacteria bacterium]